MHELNKNIYFIGSYSVVKTFASHLLDFYHSAPEAIGVHVPAVFSSWPF